MRNPSLVELAELSNAVYTGNGEVPVEPWAGRPSAARTCKSLTANPFSASRTSMISPTAVSTPAMAQHRLSESTSRDFLPPE